MSSFETPFAAAETVVPFLSEWPENPTVDMPAQRSNSLTLSTTYCLLKGPNVLENNGWDGSRGKRSSKWHKARTWHIEDDGEGASWIATPFRKGSVLEAGKMTVAELLRLMVTCPLDKWNCDDADSHESHVNSPDRRNAANATQRAVLRLTLSKSSCLISATIQRRIGL